MLKPERTTLKNIQHFVQTPQDFFKTNQQKPRKYPKNSAFSSHLCPAVCTIPEMPSATLSTPKVMKLFIRVQANLSESVIEGLTCPLLTLQGWGCATGTILFHHFMAVEVIPKSPWLFQSLCKSCVHRSFRLLQ